MAKKDELAKAEPAALAMPSAPSFMKNERTGFENVHDMTFDRLKLMQSGCPELKNKDLKAEVGGLFRKTTNECLYAPGTRLRVIPVYYFVEYVEFGDKKDPNQPLILNRSLDPLSPVAQEAKSWVMKINSEGKKVKKVNDVHNFICLREGFLTDPFMISFSRTSVPFGKGWLTFANQRGEKPLYAGWYDVFTTEERAKQPGQTDYYVIRTKPMAYDDPKYWVNEQEYKTCESWHKLISQMMKAGSLKTDLPDEPDDDGVPGTPAAGADPAKPGDL